MRGVREDQETAVMLLYKYDVINYNLKEAENISDKIEMMKWFLGAKQHLSPCHTSKCKTNLHSINGKANKTTYRTCIICNYWWSYLSLLFACIILWGCELVACLRLHDFMSWVAYKKYTQTCLSDPLWIEVLFTMQVARFYFKRKRNTCMDTVQLLSYDSESHSFTVCKLCVICHSFCVLLQFW